MRTIYPLLLIDAGNSRVKWCLLDADGQQQQGGFFDKAFSPETIASLTHAWTALPSPQAIWISNVAGTALGQQLTDVLNQQWPGIAQHWIKASDHCCGIVNHYTAPQKLGSDRWAGMIGARAAWPDEALLIATIGTATTIEAIDANGHFLGGLIAPGWTLMMRSLGDHTAQLPRYTIADARAESTPAPAPAALFAQDTANAVTEGCRLAQVSFIEQAWHQFSARSPQAVRCVIGGGAAEHIVTGLSIPHTVHRNLVLEGIAQIARSAGADLL